MGFLSGGTKVYDPWRAYMRMPQMYGTPRQPGQLFDVSQQMLGNVMSPKWLSDFYGYGVGQLEQMYGPMRTQLMGEMTRRGGGTAPSWSADALASLYARQAAARQQLYQQGLQQQMGLQQQAASWLPGLMAGMPQGQMYQQPGMLGNLLSIGAGLA